MASLSILVGFVVVVVATTKSDTLRASEVSLLASEIISDSTGVLLSVSLTSSQNLSAILDWDDQFTVEKLISIERGNNGFFVTFILLFYHIRTSIGSFLEIFSCIPTYLRTGNPNILFFYCYVRWVTKYVHFPRDPGRGLPRHPNHY